MASDWERVDWHEAVVEGENTIMWPICNELSLFCSLFLVTLVGCGDAHITDLRTTDRKIRITIKDPSECDESRYVYGIVAGIPMNPPGQRFGLVTVACGEYIDGDEFVLLEGTNWCAVAEASVIAQNPTNPLDAVCLIIDRDAGKIYVVDGTGFAGCSELVKKSVSAAAKTFLQK